MRAPCLIACQGSAQLVAAMVAADIRPGGEGDDARPFTVLIHDLFAPAGQDADFVRVLEQVARLGRGCGGVRYVAPEEMAALRALRQTAGLEAAARELVVRLELGELGELYLGQNALPLNELLRCGYRAATKVCYGDGLGVNFSPTYFAASQEPRLTQPHPLRALRSAVSRVLGRVRRAGPAQAHLDPGFDRYCLLLPNLFDERLSAYDATGPSAFRELFSACAALQPPALRARYAELRARGLQASSVVVLLSTNFSEAGKMTRQAELDAYAAFVGELSVGSNALLVIKPHPRDSQSKIDALRSVLAAQFTDCAVLDDPFSFYLPFEVIFADCFLDWPADRPPPSVACFSTACLSLEYLYGVRCVVGFGDDLVLRHMAPEWREHRQRHERDLRDATAVVRANRERAPEAREWPRP